jgi:hypothetical protein
MLRVDGAKGDVVVNDPILVVPAQQVRCVWGTEMRRPALQSVAGDGTMCSTLDASLFGSGFVVLHAATCTGPTATYAAIASAAEHELPPQLPPQVSPAACAFA